MHDRLITPSTMQEDSQLFCVDNGIRNFNGKAPESPNSPSGFPQCQDYTSSGSSNDANSVFYDVDTVFHDSESMGFSVSTQSETATPKLRKWKRIDREKGVERRKEEVNIGKPFVFKTKSWCIKPGAKKEVRSKIKLAKRNFSGYKYILKDPDLRGVVPRYRKFQAGEGVLWSTTEYRELLEAYKDEVANGGTQLQTKKEGEEVLNDNKDSEMEKAADLTEVLLAKAKCLTDHQQKMQNDRFNSITATESSTRTIIQPSSENGRQGQVVTRFMKLLISGGILLCFTGITLTSAVLCIILIMISSPIWVPIIVILLISGIGFLWVCGMGALIFGLPWMYKYSRGRCPLGSDWVNDARNRIMGTASQMRDHTLAFLNSKVKDVAPDA